jgi:Flp pilus assembly protein TadG
MAAKKGRRRGSLLVEFTLCAIPLMFVLISITELSLTMWNYHTLAEAVDYSARYASSHGAGCAGQSCATTVGTIATLLANRAVGIPSGSINATLTSASSGAVTCNPLSSCTSSSSPWPSASANTAGTDVTISASYAVSLPIPMFAPKQGAGSTFSPLTLGAQSRQMVVY